MDYFHVFVLTSLSIDENGDVKRRNVAVTFDLFEALPVPTFEIGTGPIRENEAGFAYGQSGP